MVNPSDADRRKALQDAKEAAVAGEPTRMLDCLFASFALDGLSRRLRDKWGFLKVDQDACNDVVAESVDCLYHEIRQGRKVSEVVSWLWKVANRLASNRERKRTQENSNQQDNLEGVVEPDRTMSDPEVDWDQRRRRAIAEARKLLPKLGQENLQAVMSYILDAIQAGANDVSNTEISEALGLSANTVAQCKLRGFDRLKRVAREADLWPDCPEDDDSQR